MSSSGYDGTEVAVIGLAGRFPGAADAEAFWRNLRDGVDSARDLAPEELAALGVPEALRADPAYVPATAQMPGIDRFDAAFFGFDEREAAVLDPQQRILLELAWEALEDAGELPDDRPDAEAPAVGVFAGASFSTYLLANVLADPALRAALDPVQTLLGNSGDALATRVSYKLNLRGPSFTVQSACSTSLVAVHLAVASLQNGECDLALAGAVSVNVDLLAGYLAREGSVLARGGRCRPFAASADGMLFGAGGGIVVLRRLGDALAAGDAVRAVLRGSAVNNDGSLKVGFAAPSVLGQAEVLTEAWSAAGVDPETLDYVEAHGTGTRLGDLVEAQALARALGQGRPRRAPCVVGSAKGNIGHLDAAAGIAGLVKTILALEHREIPPSLHAGSSNPEVDWAGGPLRLATALAGWPATPGRPRRAGVSSFGIGGTNAHVVVEEAPPAASGPSRPWDLLVLSARSREALERATDALAEHLDRRVTEALAKHLEDRATESGAEHLESRTTGSLAGHPVPNPLRELAPELSDIAFTLQVGRRRFAHRRTLVCRPAEDLAALLRRRDPERVATTTGEAAAAVSVVFLVPAVDAGWSSAVGALYREEPAFRREVDRTIGRAADPASPLAGALRDGLAAGALAPESERAGSSAIQLALARLWIAWGVRPAALCGAGAASLAASLAGGSRPPVVDLAELRREPGRALLELGPGALAAEVLRHPADPAVSSLTATSLATENDPHPGAALARALAALWRAGVRPDWAAFHAGERRRRVPLPTYPFERRHCWTDAPGAPRPLGGPAE